MTTDVPPREVGLSEGLGLAPEREGAPMYNELTSGIVAEIAALRQECEALRKDAERYRWLRDNACTTQANTLGPIFRMDVQIVGKWHLGDAVDAAMTAMPAVGAA